MTQSPIITGSSPSEDSYDDFECRLIRALGAAVGASDLSKALGYPTQEAFRKAHQRGKLPVPTFALPGRRGRYAAATDIAQWLWQQRSTATTDRAPGTD